MKKISIILAAFALAVTMTQCKKNEGQTTSNDEVVTITLDVSQNNDSKVVVNPNTGTVDFETGDKIYVGSGGKYVGFLTHNGTNFSGNITNPAENQPLQFYFLGNVTPQETLAAGTTEECSVIISDQTEHLPVISRAASNENYVSGVTAYSAHLLNKCALVKFNVTTSSTYPTCIMGMNNKVAVDFANNSLDFEQNGDGVIMLGAGSGEKWAILLPQEAMNEGVIGTAFSYDGIYSGKCPEMPAVVENNYWADGFSIILHPTGAVEGLFSVSPTQQVYFSQGLLQYQPISHTWRFADSQLSCSGNDGNTGGYDPSSYQWIDFFGWGTSGFEHGAVCYEPWSISTTYSDYYAYGDAAYNLFDQTGQADWGYNAISNGGNRQGQWRTLSKTEWEYLLETRSTNSGIRFANVTINDYIGLILLPDNWNSATYVLSNPNTFDASFSSNVIDYWDWVNTLEPSGAVLLIAAGNRYSDYFGDVKIKGVYWTSTCSDSENAYVLYFYNEIGAYGLENGIIDVEGERCCGYSVRLVHNAE